MTAKSPNPRHAHFPVNVGQEPKKKEKILTIRYGKNQMALIRKRLRVEAWLYDALETLTREHEQHKISEERVEDGVMPNGKLENSSCISAELDIDVDQILDVDGDCQRRQWLEEKLKICTAPTDVVQTFINDFLERLKTL